MQSALIVTANRFFRESLVRLFRSDKTFRVVGATDFSAFFGHQELPLRPHIVVLRPEWSDAAFRSARAIHDACPGAKILMIGMDDEQEMFVRAVRAGAEGYLLKDASAKQILGAAHRLIKGAVVCPPHLERGLFNYVADGLQPQTFHPEAAPELTPREQQLTSLVAQGLANKEIAGRLNLSLQTVKNHVHSILQKTQSRNRAMLVQFVEARASAMDRPSRLPLPRGLF